MFRTTTLLITLMFWVHTNLQAQCDIVTQLQASYSTSVTASGMPSSLSGITFSITSDFAIDDDVVWDDCIVLVEDGITITIEDGFELSIDDGTIVSPDLGFSWVGFVVEPNAHIEVLDESVICGADIAIDANSASTSTAANYTVDNSHLLNNIVGIEVSNFSVSDHPGVFSGSTISGPENLEGTDSEYGIRVLNVGDAVNDYIISLGSGTGLTDNLIEDLPIGVYALNSLAWVRNTEFENITFLNSTLDGTAVLANTTGTVVGRITVGGGATRKCSFTDCRIGVDVLDYETVNVNDNDFLVGSGAMFRAVVVAGTTEELGVVQNTISGFDDIAVFLDQNSPSFETQVRLNNIVGTFGTTRGIYMDEHTGIYEISNNDVSDVNRAIIVQSSSAGTGGTAEIEDNDIEFSYPGTPAVFGAGILIAESDDIDVFINDIIGNCAAPCSTATTSNRNIRGIYQFSSEEIRLYANSTSNCGAGIFVQENSNASVAGCNYMNTCFTGFAFDEIDPGEYGEDISGTYYVNGAAGSTTIPSDNQWDTYEWKVIMVDGGAVLTSTEWLHRNTAGSAYDLLTTEMFPTPPATSPPSPIVTNVGTPCDGSSLRMAGSVSEPSSASSLRLLDSLEIYDASDISNDLYEVLLSCANGHQCPDDSLAQAWTEWTNLAELLDVHTAIANRQTDAARTALNSLAPINALEECYMRVLNIKANVVDSAAAEPLSTDLTQFLTASERTYLEDVVYNQPYSATRGASMWAQSLLGVLEIEDGWQETPSARRAESPSSALSLFPNPASTTQAVRIGSEELKAASHIVATDMYGHRVLSLPIDQWGNEGLNFAVPGMYQVALLDAQGRPIKTGMVFILAQ